MTEFKYTYPEDYWDLQLPVNGSHNPYFATVGFIFGSFEKNDKLRDTKLPKGWTAVTSNNDTIHLLDENMSRRALVKLGDNCYMHPCRRFSLDLIEKSPIQIEFCVWDNDVKYNIEKALKVYSKLCPLPNKSQHPDAYKQRVQQYREEQACEKWLNKHFPKWNDYDSYWGEKFNFENLF